MARFIRDQVRYLTMLIVFALIDLRGHFSWLPVTKSDFAAVYEDNRNYKSKAVSYPDAERLVFLVLNYVH